MSTEIIYRVSVIVPDTLSKEHPKIDAAAFIPEVIQAIEQRCAPMEVLNIDVEDVCASTE